MVGARRQESALDSPSSRTRRKSVKAGVTLAAAEWEHANPAEGPALKKAPAMRSIDSICRADGTRTHRVHPFSEIFSTYPRLPQGISGCLGPPRATSLSTTYSHTLPAVHSPAARRLVLVWKHRITGDRLARSLPAQRPDANPRPEERSSGLPRSYGSRIEVARQWPLLSSTPG